MYINNKFIKLKQLYMKFYTQQAERIYFFKDTCKSYKNKSFTRL